MTKYLKLMGAAIAAAFIMPNMAMANTVEMDADTQAVHLEDLEYAEDALLDENFSESDIELLQRRRPGRGGYRRGCIAPAFIRIGRCNLSQPGGWARATRVRPGESVFYRQPGSQGRVTATLQCRRGRMIIIQDDTRACYGRWGRPDRGRW